MGEQANGRPIASALGGWSERGHGSLAQRLAHALRAQIDAGLIGAGTRLPPERMLARQLAVSRATVTAALDQLRADQVISSRRGAGTVVTGGQLIDLDGISHRMAEHLVAGAGGVDLAVGNPYDVGHLPPMSLDVAAILSSGAGNGFHPLGLPTLRRALAERYTARGLVTHADEIHVTAGAHQAVSLLVAAHTRPRDVVAAASPGYPGFFDIVDAIGARSVPIDTDRGGLRPESLAGVLAEHRPSVVYLQHGPHNPTGVVSGVARRRALARVLDDHPDTLVIEDATLAPLTFAGFPEPELVRLCRRATVASVGSFSKVLWAGLRLGWLRAPVPIIERTLRRMLGSDLGAAIPSQLLALGWLPQLDEIAAQRRTFLRDHVTRGGTLLRAQIPEWTFDDPAGASALWVDTGLADTTALVATARRHGVHIASGAITMPGTVATGHLRLCVDRPWPLVEAGIERLSSAWRDVERRAASNAAG